MGQLSTIFGVKSSTSFLSKWVNFPMNHHLIFPPFIILLFLLFSKLTVGSNVEKIRIWRIFPRWAPQRDRKLNSAEKSRHEFMEAMGPERMAEMWKVRRNLAEINRRMMAKWEVEGRMEPSAMLAQAMAMEEQREERKAKGGGISQMNSAIGDFLYQNDILLDANQTQQMLADLGDRNEGPITILIEEEQTEREEESQKRRRKRRRRRRRRQAQTGRYFPRNQWDPTRPIPYIFDSKLNENTRKLVRLAAQFWTEHTCLSFAENGQSSPWVKFFPGGGCYSQVGKVFQQREQLISLGKGCEQFGIAAHEIGHTLGFFHGQARFDRDQFVNVVYSNLSPHMAGQFVKQRPEDNFNFGITYDYGSIMHYSDTDVSTNRVTMLAKERIYQHTMGNNVAPSFLDVLEMNLYYKCTAHCNSEGADCKNGGYRHPRDCFKCSCPDGFGGFDCSARASPAFGAPPNCGATLEAHEGPLETLNGSVSAAATGNGMAERHAQCWWHIRAPSGKRVQLRVKSVSGACSDGCFYGGTELKTREFLRVGARICCRSDVRQLGLLYSNTELALVSVFSQYKTQRFSIEYRAVEASMVPAGGFGDYDDLEGTKAAKQRHEEGGGGGGKESNAKNEGGGKQFNECQDIAGNCFSLLHLCENSLYRTLMGRQCAKTCLQCGGTAGNVENAGNNAAGPNESKTNSEGGGEAAAGECGKKDHESCHTWANNGFCQSKSYSLPIKRQICPKECRLC